MRNGRRTVCERLIPCLIGECDERERRRFLSHLRRCRRCQQEWTELREAWQAIAWDAEPAEPPDELKQLVMEAVRDAGAKADARADAPVRSQRRRRRFAASGAVVVLLAVAVGWAAWESGTIGRPDADGSTSARKAQELVLTAKDPRMPNAAGRAYLDRSGGRARLVVGLTGLEPTQGKQVYRVWIIRDGRRYNCGALRVGADGTGMLAYDLPHGIYRFYSIGVTLEPDGQETDAPRGPKVAGT